MSDEPTVPMEPPEPRHETPQLGTRERLRRARRMLTERQLLLSPSQRGGHGCLMAGLHAATVGGVLVALAAPCTAGIGLVGTVGALAGLALGAVIGVPIVIGTTNALKTLAIENAAATTERPALPKAGSGGNETSVAVPPTSRRDPP